LYYNFITDVYLGYISIEEFKHKIIVSIKTVLGIKNGVKQKFVTGFYGLKIKRTIKIMLNNLFYKKQSNKYENEDVLQRKIWNNFLSSTNINLNSLYYAMENYWWIESKYLCICKQCKMSLSFKHILVKHKEILGMHSDEIQWLMKIKNDYNFSKAALQLNGDGEYDLNLKINRIFKAAISLKEKAVKT